MPNIKSAEKRVQISREQNERNRAGRSALKTSIKKFDAAVTTGNSEEVHKTYNTAIRSIDKAASKGLIHKNNAARKKSSVDRKRNTSSK